VPSPESPPARAVGRRTRAAIVGVVVLSAIALVSVPLIILDQDPGGDAPKTADGSAEPMPPVPSGAPTTHAPESPVTADADPPGDSAASPSGEAAPVGDLPGWTQTFVDEFETPVAGESFPGPYRSSWLPYDGFTDTSDLGVYRAEAVSVDGGVLALGVAATAEEATSSAVVPLVDGRWGGQTFGRYSVRLRSDPVPGYSASLLLWSDDNDWDDGEIDFPQGHLDDVVRAYNHTPGDPSVNSYAQRTDVPFDEWHTYTIEWKPDEIVYLIDGETIGTARSDIPTASMHWVMQIETAQGGPPDGVRGAVQVDWATIYRYDG